MFKYWRYELVLKFLHDQFSDSRLLLYINCEKATNHTVVPLKTQILDKKKILKGIACVGTVFFYYKPGEQVIITDNSRADLKSFLVKI